MQTQTAAENTWRENVAFDNLHKHKYAYNASDTPEPASVGQRKSGSECETQERPDVRNRVQNSRQSSDARPCRYPERGKADGIQDSHTKCNEQLSTGVGCEDAPNLIEESAKGVAKTRRNQILHRISPRTEVYQDVKNKERDNK